MKKVKAKFKNMVGIIKYGSGNIFSVISAVKYIGKKTILIDKPETIDKVNFIILPGVGNFGAGIEFLRKMELYEAIIDKVNNGIPFLGICLGFQFLFEWSEEGN
ncbi:MAG: imidazole glycerol phosphate synthase subunit HisH, partial [bacterium]|nr:imidazole glycerol phosphate synthase subunit HisH [bacterium]MDW8163945.1 imidazole glycerol phosphate synthase subunit HisH [Candidatus Omnitrophota bacterium]